MACLSFIWLLLSSSLPAQQPLEKLVVNRQIYLNVVVQSKTATHVFFNHDQGFASVKINDLPPAVLKQLGYAAGDPAPAPAASRTAAVAQLAPQVWEKTVAISQPFQKVLLPILLKLFWLIIALLVLIHLLASFCLLVICHKAGQPPGLIIWIPLLQIFPLLKAANMSAWNFLLFCLFPFTILAALIWCVKICKSLHKNRWLGLFLFLPVTSIFTLLYLAFSNGGDADEQSPVIKLDYPENVASE